MDGEPGNEVTLADNIAGRGPAERIFESYQPILRPLNQDEARVGSYTRFVNPLGNWSLGCRLQVSWREATQSLLAAKIHSIPGDFAGRGSLSVIFADGQEVILAGAVLEDLQRVELLEVLVLLEFTFKCESFQVP